MTQTNHRRLKRFTPVQRLFHLLLMGSFLLQGASGLARMFVETGWGRSLGFLFGGYENARTVHIYVGVFMLCTLAVHIAYMLSKIDRRRLLASLFGPDSLLPRKEDIRQFSQHVAWLFGARKPPAFDRWGYWEKFDYWAVFWGMTIIGVTGLLMAYPLTSTRWMPGWGLNVAFWVHRIEAILAMAHIFIIHYFIGHLRRQNFPMDRAMFEGSIDLEAAREERPAWVARLEGAGRLEGALVAGVPSGVKTIYYVVGFTAICAGLLLLIGALANVPSITW